MDSLTLPTTSHLSQGKTRIKFQSVFFIPIFIVLMSVVFHYFYHYYLITHFQINNIDLLTIAEGVLYSGIIVLSFLWIINRLIKQGTTYFLSSSYATSHHILNIVVFSLAKIVRGIVFIVLFNLFIQSLHLPLEFSYLLDKVSYILVFFALGWIAFQLIISAEQLLLLRYTAKNANAFSSRKSVTQLLILKRIALIITVILVSGSILMLFDNVKTLGASVLTTAGIIGLVMTFTAQKTLGGLFSGLEIALTQPIKIGDSVVIENEFGVIEEINFRNVVIKLWDWRRLIVPTNHFLEKPFQNWSREESNNLIGTVYLYVDYTLPIPELRDELKKILSASLLWDGNVNGIQVSDLQDKVMQLRILSSADSPAKAWDLRCEVREKLISFIAKKYPECLPLSRSKTFKEI